MSTIALSHKAAKLMKLCDLEGLEPASRICAEDMGPRGVPPPPPSSRSVNPKTLAGQYLERAWHWLDGWAGKVGLEGALPGPISSAETPGGLKPGSRGAIERRQSARDSVWSAGGAPATPTR